MELLRDSGLPIIGHNVGLDLLFVISQFVTPLPPSWAEFQALAREWLPGGVFDTKLLSKDLPFAVFQGDTSLGNIHRALGECHVHWDGRSGGACIATASR